jgi:hypothetical protein
MSGFLGGGIGPAALKRRRAAADWWQVAGQTCVAAYQPIGAASLAASYVNLANPGVNNAAPGVAPTLAAGGWSFATASSQYLNTLLLPDVGWSMVIRYSNVTFPSNVSYLAGTRYSNNRFYIALVNTPSIVYGYGNTLTVNRSNSNGVAGVVGGTGYFNGSAESGALIWVSAPNETLLIGVGRSSSGALEGYLSGTIAAVAIYKPTEPSTTPMSAADVAALTTRMQALA